MDAGAVSWEQGMSEGARTVSGGVVIGALAVMIVLSATGIAVGLYRAGVLPGMDPGLRCTCLCEGGGAMLTVEGQE